MRRQAKLEREDYSVLADDLLEFPDQDIVAGLEELGLRPRREGETAFPDSGTLRAAVKEARGERLRKLREAAEREEEARWKREYERDHAAQSAVAPTETELLLEKVLNAKG